MEKAQKNFYTIWCYVYCVLTTLLVASIVIEQGYVNKSMALIAIFAFFAGSIWLIVSVFRVVKAFILKSRRKKSVYQTVATIVVGLISIGLVSYVWWSYGSKSIDIHDTSYSYESAVANQEQQIQTYQNPEVIGVLKSVGPKIDYSELNLLYHDEDILPENSKSIYNNERVYGLYSEYNGSFGLTKFLSIRRGVDLYVVKSTVAHEFLHYAWYKDNLDSDTGLVQGLNNLFNDSQNLRSRMSDYISQNAVSPTEIFSIACTELPDGELQGIAAYCNKYIDTSTLMAQYNI